MKKLLSIILALGILASVFSFTGVSVYAAESKYNVQKQQFNTQNSSFNFSGNKFAYFYYNGEKYELRYTASFGKKGKAIAKADYGANVTIKGSYVYWIDYITAKLMRCKTNGKSKKAVVEFNSDSEWINYIISGDRLIYSLITFDSETGELKSNTLYTAKLNGSGKKVIAKNVRSDGYYTYKNNVYFLKDSKLLRYNFKTKKTYTVKTKMKNVFLNGMEGNTLYYYKESYDDNGVSIFTVYTVNVSTKKAKKVTKFKSEEPVYSSVSANGKIYAITGTGAGCGFAQVKKGKLDYESFEKKYDLGGESLGYFKNYIIMENLKVSKNGDYTSQGYVKMVKVK